MQTVALSSLTECRQHADLMAEKTAARVVRAEKAAGIAAAVALAPSIPDLWMLPKDMDKAINDFNACVFSDQSELRQAAGELCQVTARVNEILKAYSRLRMDRLLIYRPLLNRISQSNEHVKSILEGLYMSLNPDLWPVIEHSARELQATLDSDKRRSGQCQSVA